MANNSKSKGNIGEAKVLARLVELGCSVLLPFGDNERYDLVVENSSKHLLKAQVKYSSQLESDGCLEFQLYSSKNHTTNKVKSGYVGEIDIFLLYHSVTDEVYLLTPIDFENRKSMFLRTKPTVNKQSKKVNFATDYILKDISQLSFLNSAG